MTGNGGQSSADLAEASTVTRVLVVWETGSATYFLRAGEEVILGRHQDCEVCIGLPSVSRRHARLVGLGGTRTAGELAIVEDLGGMNGVRVRGQTITPGTPVPIGAGDVIELGGAIAILHPPRGAGAPSAGALVRAVAHRPASEDPARSVDRLLDVVAESDLALLLVGEDGTGKTHAAETVHARSFRAAGPLVRVSCRGRHPDILSRELFGDTSPGALENAGGGTLLIEEIELLPPRLQRRLHDVLETREVRRPEHVALLDARLVTTSRTDLLRACNEAHFRLDLYYRLTGVNIVLPPLRERKGEIGRFAVRFLASAAKRLGRPVPRVSNEALGVLLHHPFPANLRELKTTMERACALSGPGYIGPEHLIFESRSRRELARTSPAIPGLRRPMVTAPTEAPEAPESLEPPAIPKAPRTPTLAPDSNKKP